jgi:hypothetical protein
LVKNDLHTSSLFFFRKKETEGSSRYQTSSYKD